MNAKFTFKGAAWRVLKPLVVVCAVLVLMLAGTVEVPAANGTSGGILPGRVKGGTGGGTIVPVGNPGGDSGLPDTRNGCVEGEGHWKNDHGDWSIGSLTIGGRTYTKSELLAILNHSNNDQTYLVAQKLIAAILNQTKGLTDNEIAQIISDANAWLTTHQIGSNHNDEHGFANWLDDFNHGGHGHTACDDNSTPITFTYLCQVDNGNYDSNHGYDGQEGHHDYFDGWHSDGDGGHSDWGNWGGGGGSSRTALTTNGGEQCSGGYFSTEYKWDGRKWVQDSHTKTCMAQSQCQPAVADNLHSSLPCDPYVAADGLTIVCAPRNGIKTANISANIDTSCPVNEVLRAPYPRALVNAETNYFLQPAIFNNPGGYSTASVSPDNLKDLVDVNGNPTATGYGAGVWRNFVLTMRSRRFTGGENWFSQVAGYPAWTFDDRPWNTGPNPKVQQGATAKYTYQTSSAGLPNAVGRGYDAVSQQPTNAYSLPAYKVDIQTTCGHEWAGTAELSQRRWVQTGNCAWGIALPNPPGGWWAPAGTFSEGCPAGQFAPGHYEYYWAGYSTSFAGIDMRLTGLASTYDVQAAARGGGQVNSSYYWDNNGANWVPVVEVQSVLRQACVAAGTCAPPVAEPGSLSP